jgi:hypothetical protein
MSKKIIPILFIVLAYCFFRQSSFASPKESQFTPIFEKIFEEAKNQKSVKDLKLNPTKSELKDISLDTIKTCINTSTKINQFDPSKATFGTSTYCLETLHKFVFAYVDNLPTFAKPINFYADYLNGLSNAINQFGDYTINTDLILVNIGNTSTIQIFDDCALSTTSVNVEDCKKVFASIFDKIGNNTEYDFSALDEEIKVDVPLVSNPKNSASKITSLDDLKLTDTDLTKGCIVTKQCNSGCINTVLNNLIEAEDNKVTNFTKESFENTAFYTAKNPYEKDDKDNALPYVSEEDKLDVNKLANKFMAYFIFKHLLKYDLDSKGNSPGGLACNPNDIIPKSSDFEKTLKLFCKKVFDDKASCDSINYETINKLYCGNYADLSSALVSDDTELRFENITKKSCGIAGAGNGGDKCCKPDTIDQKKTSQRKLL